MKTKIRINQFCCGCSLQTGTKVVGALSLIFQIIGLVIFLLSTSSDASDVEGGIVSFKFIGRIISTIFLVTAIILVLVSARRNNRPMLLLPWLILQVLSIITGIVYSLYIGICLLIAVPNISGLIFMTLGLGASIIGIYFWLVVYSFYHELKEITKKQPKVEEKTTIVIVECEKHLLTID
ncbi:hypothetical protein DAPPUDRAFT_313851 [Daphnia pulex]|uniref:MARVEL domain-containing protein n=1 Tax=Daphnia pulex TaxID=6669 RepID=E9G5G4_DAPPU|nr:hypothetical protein DAPPUDRAFT_313851 [Daphnia pulex]|eukprot:EFX85201.1 hypothetical protein DAPPUDRAFT_313851 [Daphnia pulex]